MKASERIARHIRSNVVVYFGLLALATMGPALATAGNEPEAGSSANAKKQVKKLKQTVASLTQRVAALEAKPAPAVPAIPTTLPPSGPAGGELAASYPNPKIGTVSGLDLASHTTAAGGISFAPDANLYRQGASLLRTDDSLSVSGDLTVVDDAQLGNGGGDEVNVSGWLNLFSPPALATDCDVSAEIGRLIYAAGTNQLWVCDDTGWLQVLAS